MKELVEDSMSTILPGQFTLLLNRVLQTAEAGRLAEEEGARRHRFPDDNTNPPHENPSPYAADPHRSQIQKWAL